MLVVHYQLDLVIFIRVVILVHVTLLEIRMSLWDCVQCVVLQLVVEMLP